MVWQGSTRHRVLVHWCTAISQVIALTSYEHSQGQLTGSTQLTDARQTILNLQTQLQAVMPRFQELMSQPGAAEIRAELTKGLSERAIARAIKLVFNQNQSSVSDSQSRRPAAGYLPSSRMQGPQASTY